MKKQFKYTPLAIALAALIASPIAMADNHDHGRGDKDKFELDSEADIEKDIKVDVDVEIEGGALVVGIIPVSASSSAVVTNKQITKDDTVHHVVQDNDAVVNGNAFQNASGNVGSNEAAGEFNQQANDAALSAVDAGFVFADAEVFSKQVGKSNSVGGYDDYYYSNTIIDNNASVTDNAFQNASGNLGLNVTAGAFNKQSNGLAVSYNSSGNMAIATSSGLQALHDSSVTNVGSAVIETGYVQVGLSGSLDGSYSGQSDQIGNIYPDTWANTSLDVDPVTGEHIVHPAGPITGHIDIDNNTQGGTDLNGDGGAFAFNEAGSVTLSGTFTGYVPTQYLVYTPQVNNASVSGNAFQNASGNIGLNVSAGFHNQQRNSLAIASSTGGTNMMPGGGGTEP